MLKCVKILIKVFQGLTNQNLTYLLVKELQLESAGIHYCSLFVEVRKKKNLPSKNIYFSQAAGG